MSAPVQNEAARNIDADRGGRGSAESRTGDFAIVIGIDDYPAFRGLRGAVRDATAFHDWLRDPDGGNLPEDHVKLVISPSEPATAQPGTGATPAPEPAQRHVDDKLEQLLRSVDDRGGGRRLYFYFAGHGARAIDAIANVALLGADWSQARSRFGLSSQGYANDLIGYGLFRELVVLLDCCRSDAGTIIGLPCSVTLDTKTVKATTRQFIAYATKAGDAAFERHDGARWEGVFTRCLLQILKRTPGISAADLKRDLERAIGEASSAQRAEIQDGLDETARFGVAPVAPPPSSGLQLSITFRPERIGPVALMNSALKTIAEHDPRSGPWQIALPLGFYKLRDGAGSSRLLEFPAENHVDF